MDMPRPWAALIGGLALSVLCCAGCVPATPDADAWRDHAATAVDDAISQVRTARLVLRLQAEDRLIGRSAVVMVVDAEDGLGSSVDAFTAEQPPKSQRSEWRRVEESLSAAQSVVTSSRMAIVDSDAAAYSDLTTQLQQVADRLEQLSEDLS